jgi:hypothetical protein
MGSNCPSAARWRGINRTSRDKRFRISWGGRVGLGPSLPETSSEEGGEAMLETKTKGNVNVNVPFCICGGGAAPEPDSAVDDDEVADGGSGGGISACAVMMCGGNKRMDGEGSLKIRSGRERGRGKGLWFSKVSASFYRLVCIIICRWDGRFLNMRKQLAHIIIFKDLTNPVSRIFLLRHQPGPRF